MLLRKRAFFLVANALMVLALTLTSCVQVGKIPSIFVEGKPTATPASPPTGTPTAVAQVAQTATQAPVLATPTVVGPLNAFGVHLPADAASPDQQYLRILDNEGATTDFAVSAYKRCSTFYCDILSTPLVRVNKNFEFVPAGALSWDVSADGLTWTFHLDPNLKWSDGNPVTADDVVFTLQYEADPTHAWDYSSFWNDIQNWKEAAAGKVPASQIGVKKVDIYTVQIVTTTPSPYFLAKALYIRPLSKAAFAKYGPNYDNDPKTSVSSSPWVLEEWTKGKQMVFGPNKNYTGKLKPYLERLVIQFGDPTTDFQAYMNNQVDFARSFSAADIALISTDPQLNGEYHPSFGDFRTNYIGFDTLDKPFNDPKVRQAFAKAIDRDAIVRNVIGRQGITASSFLMPGFPDSNANQLKNEDVNKYDPATAQKLLAEAGYPNGKGFPYLYFWMHDQSPLNMAVANVVAGMIKTNLGIPVVVNSTDAKFFATEFNAHKVLMYMSSDGFSYLDPSNMLSGWVSGGQHPWKNDAFDQLVNGASSLVGQPSKRDQMFKDAEKILVDEVPAVFLYHATPGYIYRPYVKGEELDPDKTGVAAWHWPGLEDIGLLMSTIYISNDVADYRQ